MDQDTEHDDRRTLLIVMLRIWRTARASGENPLPPMQAKATALAASPEFVIAADSLFALTEAVLGRALRTGRCCSARLTPDEAALCALVRHAPCAGAIRTSRTVPHGLPGALCWAVLAVRRSQILSHGLSLGGDDDREPLIAPPPRCPFTDTAGLAA